MHRREQRGGTCLAQGADGWEGGLAEEGPRAARWVVQGGGVCRVPLPLQPLPGSGRLPLVPGGRLWHAAACSFLGGALCCGTAMRGVRWGSGREHMQQVRDGLGVPRVQVDPQEGGTRGARLAVREGLRAVDASLQRLLLCAPARARDWLWPGARGPLETLRAPVGARRRGGGHRVALPAEVAGAWEVGGRGPGVEAGKPEVVPPLVKGAPQFQQAGADTAPVVPIERFLPDRLPRVVREYPVVVEGRYEVSPRRAGVPLGGRAIGVMPGEVGHKSVPPAPVCGVLVEVGQQGAVRDRLQAHPQPAAAVQLPAQRGGKVCWEHQEQGSWNVAEPGQGVIVRRPLFHEMRHSEPGAPVLWREPPESGCVTSPRLGACWWRGALGGGGGVLGGARTHRFSTPYGASGPPAAIPWAPCPTGAQGPPRESP